MSESETGRSNVEESLHYLMINVLVDSLERDGFTVSADHVGGLRNKPVPISGRAPDLHAQRGQDTLLIEVETQSTLGLPETRQRLRDVAAASGGRIYLAVPFTCLGEARRLREELALDIEILPCYPFVRYVGMPK
jgi:hypothetical protein